MIQDILWGAANPCAVKADHVQNVPIALRSGAGSPEPLEASTSCLDQCIHLCRSRCSRTMENGPRLPANQANSKMNADVLLQALRDIITKNPSILLYNTETSIKPKVRACNFTFGCVIMRHHGLGGKPFGCMLIRAKLTILVSALALAWRLVKLRENPEGPTRPLSCAGISNLKALQRALRTATQGKQQSRHGVVGEWVG